MTKRYDPNCLECKGTGERDSGGTYPWGDAILVPCDCDDPIVPGHERRGIYWSTMSQSELDKLNKEIDDGVNAILAKHGVTEQIITLHCGCFFQGKRFYRDPDCDEHHEEDADVR